MPNSYGDKRRSAKRTPAKRSYSLRGENNVTRSASNSDKTNRSNSSAKKFGTANSRSSSRRGDSVSRGSGAKREETQSNNRNRSSYRSKSSKSSSKPYSEGNRKPFAKKSDSTRSIASRSDGSSANIRGDRSRSDRTRASSVRSSDGNKRNSVARSAVDRNGRSGRSNSRGARERDPKFDMPRRFRGDLPRRERDQRARGDAPVIDQDITGDELGDELTAELKTLPAGLTITVAQHLVMTQRYLEIDPAIALTHAKHAKELAGRFPIVREIVGIAHYVNGNWQEALNDFRAVKRMSSADHLIPMMADCERGLGRPERALTLLAANNTLSGVDRIEAAIVESGARTDLEQFEAAMVALKIPALTGFPADQTAYARLCFAYGSALQNLNLTNEAQSWFRKADAADPAATVAAKYLEPEAEIIYLDDLDADQ